MTTLGEGSGVAAAAALGAAALGAAALGAVLAVVPPQAATTRATTPTSAIKARGPDRVCNIAIDSSSS